MVAVITRAVFSACLDLSGASSLVHCLYLCSFVPFLLVRHQSVRRCGYAVAGFRALFQFYITLKYY